MTRRAYRKARRRAADRDYAALTAEETKAHQDARARIVLMDDGVRHVYRGAWSVLRLGQTWLPENPDGEALRPQHTADAACDYIDRVLDRRTA